MNKKIKAWIKTYTRKDGKQYHTGHVKTKGWIIFSNEYAVADVGITKVLFQFSAISKAYEFAEKERAIKVLKELLQEEQDRMTAYENEEIIKTTIEPIL